MGRGGAVPEQNCGHSGQSDVPGCVVVEVASADAELAADLCWFAGATAVGEGVGAGGAVTLEAGFTTDDEAVRAAATLRRRLPVATVAVVDAGPALDAALDAWKTHARPVRAGRRLVVWPDWIDPGGLDDGLVRPGDVVVRIDPGRAFGSGSHPSTRLCLGVLDDLVDPASSVLDVGCGSGVLAVAAALLGADPVVAVDVDPVAVAATRDNAAANGMTGRVVASTTPVGEITGTSSVVVANIGAATLVELAGDIVARLAPGGTLVLAGLLTSSWDRVRVAYEAHDLMLVAVPEEEGWVAPVFTNPRRA